MPKSLKASLILKIARRTVLTLLAIGAVVGGYIGYLQSTNNFHAVVPGVVYRSAQPNANDIQTYVEQLGLRSIVNLRGSHPGSAWYNEEASAARAYGVELIDYPISGTRILPDDRLHALLALIEQAPKPTLIHCEAGADRTGLAAALYLLAIHGSDFSTASSELTLAKGHFPFIFSKSGAMDVTLANYAQAIGIAPDGRSDKREAASTLPAITSVVLNDFSIVPWSATTPLAPGAPIR